MKALRLLYNSNPTLFEWFSSPIVYRKMDFVEKFKQIMSQYFSSKRGLYHYISMASGNYREYLKSDMVRAKKYFYVLRPILACRWILHRGTPPPVLFSELMEGELISTLKSEVQYLLDIKRNSPEIQMIPKIEVINQYIESSITEIKDTISKLSEEPRRDWTALNELFLSQIKRT